MNNHPANSALGQHHDRPARRPADCAHLEVTMLSLLVALLVAVTSAAAVITASIIARRGAAEAARIQAADPVRLAAAVAQFVADLEATQQQHDAAIEVASIQAGASIEVARLGGERERPRD